MNITRSDSADGTCILTFDRQGSSANVFDRATLDELDAHLAALEKETGIRGVVLASAKPKIFIAGADLNAFKHADERNLADIVNLGHGVFSRLNRLPVPSVAAINGVCLGGGLEVALACDWRVASLDQSTKLGLPETQLGIIPAWGGSTRLPKLIGLPQALGLILTGKQLAAQPALKLGLIDDVTHPEYLLESARRLLARGKRAETARRLTSRMPVSALVAAKARRDVRAKTRGHYPAPLKAIEVCAAAVGAPVPEGLAREKAAFLELVRSPECRNLMNVFFLQERAKKIQLPAADAKPRSAVSMIRKVAVIGAGTMGAGIAQWTSARGLAVRLKDINPEALARGMHAIEKVYADAVKRRVFTLPEATAGLDRITPIHTDVSLTDVDLVIEAALEKLEIKQQVFRELERAVGPDTILATNTSALSIDAIASVLARPERLVGLHFFNPVHRMQLVEIVRGPRTSPAVLEGALQFVKAIGKLPVIAKDSPGFLVNRILLPYMVEAVWLFTEGVPAPEIDRLMLDFGMPMGPMRLGDEVGLDVAQHVAKDLERRLPNPVPINDTLEKMVAKGWLGKKSGRGFYLHPTKGSHTPPNPEAGFLQPEKSRPSNPASRLDRMVLIMINEAARVLEEGVVDSPEDVDFGMIMGTGWAPFRGGPLRYADTLGAAEIVRRLEVLVRDVAPHFAPCWRLREMAREQRGFYDADAATGPGRDQTIQLNLPAVEPRLDVDVPLVSGSGPLGQRVMPAATPPSRQAAGVK
ncbi:MAG: 3-hydroxyacyl-CoA dehydrogenase NAD-binding domain-containing protein [Opitutaceae bacterium]|nr:3-hydroxyacyl-CoA dehydrogenase NAD-binding domain-containing protein [Opitutaceae bacterium]